MDDHTLNSRYSALRSHWAGTGDELDRPQILGLCADAAARSRAKAQSCASQQELLLRRHLGRARLRNGPNQGVRNTARFVRPGVQIRGINARVSATHLQVERAPDDHPIVSRVDEQASRRSGGHRAPGMNPITFTTGKTTKVPAMRSGRMRARSRRAISVPFHSSPCTAAVMNWRGSERLP